MRVLLDENVDRRLRRFFDAAFEVVTVAEHGWSGTQNGALPRMAAAEFDAFVTMDRNIQYQQQLATFDLVFILITARSNRRQDIEPVMPDVNNALHVTEPNQLTVIAAS